MKVTRFRIALSALILTAAFWVPASNFPLEVRDATNGGYFFFSIMLAFLLLPDVIDILRSNGSGISWQVAFAKLGIFLLAGAFCISSAWGLLVSAADFPQALIRSPIGTYLRYLQGIGLAGLFFGLSNPGEVTPQFTARGVVLLAMGLGVVIGLVLSHIQI